MAKFLVIKEITNVQGQDGSAVDSVWENEDINVALRSAKVQWLNVCRINENADDVLKGVIVIHDEDGNTVGGNNGFRYEIDHSWIQPEPEPSEE